MYIVLEDLKKVQFYFSPEGWAGCSVRKAESRSSELFNLGKNPE